MGAVVALGGGVGIRVNVEGIVGTSLHARLAADAAVFVKVHDTIRPEIERLHWANLHTGCVSAMVAAHDGKHAPGMRELTLLHLFYPSAKDTDWHIVLRFAGGCAGVAANALAVVYDKSKFHVFLAGLVRNNLTA